MTAFKILRELRRDC